MTDAVPATPGLPALPARPDDAHKGTFGTVVVVGGSPEMIGAPALAAGAALRIGCGLAKIATLRTIMPHCLTIEPSATGIGFDYDGRDAATDTIERRLADGDVLAVGPGIGVGARQQDLIAGLLRMGRTVVLDADGLTNLTAMRDATLVPRCPLVLTPHPGEFRRLGDAAGVHDDPTDPAQRPNAAMRLAKAFNAVVVLKGRHTVIADEQHYVLNQTGNAALATAGTGDVLTGMIAGLIAQGMKRFEAATLAAHLHGLAADLWAAEYGPAGLTARTLIEWIPKAMYRK